jgi:hypothetical protein
MSMDELETIAQDATFQIQCAMCQIDWLRGVLHVQEVSAEHLEEQRRCLLSGEQPRLLIPIRKSPVHPLPAKAFSGLPDLELAQVGFNYASRVSEHIQGNCPRLVELDLARSHSLDALNALSVLICRLSAGDRAELQDKSVSAVMINAPASETLQ